MSIQINILGRVTSEVEVSTTQSGKDIAKFSVVSNTGKGDKEVSTFINFTVFGDAIERVSKALKKGSVVSVNGRDFQGYAKKNGDGIGYSAIFTDFTYLPYNSAPVNTPQSGGTTPKASGFAGGGPKRNAKANSSPKANASPKDEQLNWNSNDDNGEEDVPF